jgi:L-lactate utilization protein LutC
MERTAFYEKLRAATAAGRAYPVALNPDATAEQSYVGGGEDPIASFLREWTAVGGIGKRVTQAAEVHEYLRELCERHGVKSALCWKHPLLDRLGVGGFFAMKGIDVRSWDVLEHEAPVQRWQKAFDAHLGVTSVDWAVAETGSLVVCSRPGQGRSCSLLPPVHVAIFEPSQLLPDLFDVFEKLGPEKDALPTNVTLITGPSKTGDIQLKLTTGVHGPGEVHALVVG